MFSCNPFYWRKSKTRKTTKRPNAAGNMLSMSLSGIYCEVCLRKTRTLFLNVVSENSKTGDLEARRLYPNLYNLMQKSTNGGLHNTKVAFKLPPSETTILYKASVLRSHLHQVARPIHPQKLQQSLPCAALPSNQTKTTERSTK
jgi:hypothetical protein